MKLKTRLQLLIAHIALAEATYKRHNAAGWEKIRLLQLVELKKALRKEENA